MRPFSALVTINPIDLIRLKKDTLKMALTWSDVDELAQALEKLYPQTDLSVLEYEELRQMAESVDGFQDQSVPDDDDLEAVINAWINIQFPEEPEKINSEDID